MADWWNDELGRRLEALAARIERDYSAVASVSRDNFSNGRIRSVQVSPRSALSVPFGWCDMQDDLQVDVGSLGHGGRWELGRTPADVSFIEDVVQAALDGRVEEIAGPRRSRVEVTLSSGELAVETGYDGCLPVPGWVRRGRRVQYAPYRS